MSHYKAYPAYKDSGVEWLGAVPEHWQVLSLGRLLATSVTDGPHETPQFLDEGVPFLSVDGIQEGELVFDNKRFISHADHKRYALKALPQREDILIGKAASVGKIARVKTDVVFNIWSPLALIRVNQATNSPAFVEYTLKSHWLQAQLETKANLNTQFNLGMKDISKVLVCAVPLQEAEQIAANLDRETARIDGLVGKKTRFIELLREKRQALITHAVTKGLDPSVKMKDSGVEWLGEVPEHWTIKHLGHFANVLRGKFTHRPRNDPAFYDGDFPFIQTGDITGTSRYITSYKQTLNERGIAVSKEFPKGTLVMAIAANIGDVAILEFSAYFPDSIVGLVPTGKSDLMFMFYLMQAMKQPMLETATISTQMNLNIEKIVALVAAQPPLNEQVQIVAHIDRETARIDTLISKTESSIALLTERRSALITAAVTGQIDLRDAA